MPTSSFVLELQIEMKLIRGMCFSLNDNVIDEFRAVMATQSVH